MRNEPVKVFGISLMDEYFFNTAFKDAVVRKILKKSLVKEFIFSKNKTEGTTTKIPEVTYFLLS